MNVLIYGDSQSGRTGKKLAERLEASDGNVTRSTHSGKSTQWLAENAEKTLDPNWDTVIIFSGGNDGHIQSKALARLLSYFKAQTRVYVPLPPATVITDLAKAKATWGSAESPTKFFSKTAKFREEKAIAYNDVARDLGYVVKDPRDAPLSNRVEQPSGVLYPSQPDGIHTDGVSAEELAVWITAPPKEGMSPLLAFGIGALAFLALRK